MFCFTAIPVSISRREILALLSYTHISTALQKMEEQLKIEVQNAKPNQEQLSIDMTLYSLVGAK